MAPLEPLTSSLTSLAQKLQSRPRISPQTPRVPSSHTLWFKIDPARAHVWTPSRWAAADTFRDPPAMSRSQTVKFCASHRS
eukprot:CAMPEP_0174898052 /NCGR_PEP_ID=MMETSP0167-20121228/19094_1 /TAXON_ID=38298 /ORGANISM="Rhodella maculata, Strain CCMP736" /LENGTH=80 /DNA_ID=CAMNT_0016138475 /DNA_START=63 /DNA_END=302 /DNA_ORIENTATION=+